MKLSEHADLHYQLDGSSGLVLSQDEVQACFLAAARYYCAHGSIAALAQYGPSDPYATEWLPTPAVTGLVTSLTTAPAEERLLDRPSAPVALDTELSAGEASLIGPLGVLYCERSNALRLEASRALGVEFYGRSTAEIAGSIAQLEDGMNKAAFSVPIVSFY